MKLAMKKIGFQFSVISAMFLLVACGTHSHKDVGNVQDDWQRGRYDQNYKPSGLGHLVVGQPQNRQTATRPGLNNVFYFDFDQDTLTPQAKTDLQAHANTLQGEGAMIRIEGHADEQGSRQYNMALGERRAKAVASYLQSLGVNASRFDIVSYGEEKPAVAGYTERAHAMNRRVELK